MNKRNQKMWGPIFLACSVLLVGAFVLVTTGLQQWVADAFVHGRASYGYSLVSPSGPIGIGIIALSFVASTLILLRLVKVERLDD